MDEERALLVASLVSGAGRRTSSGELTLSPVDRALAALCPVASPSLAGIREGMLHPLHASELERSSFGSGFRAVLILGEACEGSGGVWQEVVAWLSRGSHSQVRLVDVESACLLGLRLSGLVEGKKFVVTLGPLLEALSGSPCPEDIRNTEVSSQATAAVVAIADVSGKINSAASDPQGGPSSVASEVALGTLLGQVIWLFAYLRERWMTSSESADTCPLPSLLIVGTFWGTSNDSGAIARIIEWTSRGGTKDSVPADDVDLREAYFGSSGDKAKKAPPKGKNKEEASPLVRAVVWMRRSSLVETAKLSKNISAEEPSPTQNMISNYLCGLAKVRTASDGSVLILRRLSKRSRGAIPIYVTSDTPSDGEEVLGSELIARSNIAMVELGVTIILDVCGLRTAGEIASTETAIVREPSIVNVETGSITSVSDAESEFNLIAAQRVLDLIEDRRRVLPPEATVTLNHLTHRNFLPSVQLFHAIQTLLSVKTSQIELFTPILLSLVDILTVVEEFAFEKDKGIGFTEEIDALVSKWKDLRALFLRRIHALPDVCSLQHITIQVNDLFCCIGDTIDDLHRRQTTVSSKIAQDVLNFFDCHYSSRTKEIKLLLVGAAENICQQTLSAFNSLADLMELASYDRLPWGEVNPVDHEVIHATIESSLQNLENLSNTQDAGIDGLSKNLHRLVDSVKGDLWRDEGLTDAVRVCCKIIDAVASAADEGRERISRIPEDAIAILDSFCQSAHRRLNDWDTEVSNLLLGAATAEANLDLKSLVKMNCAADVLDKLKSHVRTHTFTVESDQEESQPPLVTLQSIKCPLELAVEISKCLAISFIEGQDFDTAMSLIASSFAQRGQSVPSFIIHRDYFADFSNKSLFRSKHRQLVQALIRNEIGTIPLGTIRRIGSIFGNSVVDLPHHLPLQYLLNEIINDTKILSKIQLSRAQALLLFESIAWTCVDADSNVVLSEFVGSLCFCAKAFPYFPVTLERHIGSEMPSENDHISIFSVQYLGLARLMLILSAQLHTDAKVIEVEEGSSFGAGRLMSVGVGVSMKQLQWLTIAAALYSMEGNLSVLEKRLLPSLVLKKRTNIELERSPVAQESEESHHESEQIENISTEQQVANSSVVQMMSTFSSEYTIDTAEPFVIGVDVMRCFLPQSLTLTSSDPTEGVDSDASLKFGSQDDIEGA